MSTRWDTAEVEITRGDRVYLVTVEGEVDAGVGIVHRVVRVLDEENDDDVTVGFHVTPEEEKQAEQALLDALIERDDAAYWRHVNHRIDEARGK